MTLCFILSIRFLKYPLQGPYSSYQNCIEFLVYLCICLLLEKKMSFSRNWSKVRWWHITTYFITPSALRVYIHDGRWRSLFSFSPKEKTYLFVLKNTNTYFVLIYIQEALSGCTGLDRCQWKQFVKVPYTNDCYTCGHFGKHHWNVGRISVEGAIH